MIIDQNLEQSLHEVLGLNPSWLAFVDDESIRGMSNNIALKEAVPPESIQPLDKLVAVLRSHIEPQVLIVDLTHKDNVIEETKTILQKCPDASRLIVIGNDDHIATFRELKRLGVTDYLTMPLEQTQLQEALIDAKEAPPRSKGIGQKTKPITVVMSARGGTGASTLCVNLAWLTANDYNKKVCVIDLDLYNGSVCILLDLTPNTGINDALTEAERLDETFLKRLLIAKDENLSVLTGQIRLGQDFTFHPEGFGKLIGLLREKFDFIYIDVSDTFNSAIAQAALLAADHAVIVTDLSLVAIQGVLRLKTFLNSSFPNIKYKIVSNQIFPAGGTVSKTVFEKGADITLEDHLPFLKNYMLEGINVGEAFAKTKHDHAYTKKLSQLIKTMYPHLSEPQRSQASLIGRLLGKSK